MRTCTGVILIILFLPCCNLLKNTRSTVENDSHFYKSEADLKLQEEQDLLNKSGSVMLGSVTDSSNFEVQVWPKGQFTWSEESGFKGEAEKILIKGNAKSRAEKMSSSSSETHDQRKMETLHHTQSKERLAQRTKVKTSSLSWKGMLLLISAFVLVCLFIYSAKKRLYE